MGRSRSTSIIGLTFKSGGPKQRFSDTDRLWPKLLICLGITLICENGAKISLWSTDNRHTHPIPIATLLCAGVTALITIMIRINI